ncbi:MAG: hypothetical protein LBD74_04125 [Spirochaetaceae bacterium]|jgi:hypothetical protein|nr:hypothetical protein [Spirochaetaceae bacterium]
MPKLIAQESLRRSILAITANPPLRRAGGRCLRSIAVYFFLLQYRLHRRALKFPGRIAVSAVDHSLDKAIPFRPWWVRRYLDFVAFWVRLVGFLLRTYRRRGIRPAREFIDAMGSLYGYAAQVYEKNLSTTQRPRYLGHPRFLVIHATDPHLMCIPSLHVMVVIRTYTAFRAIARSLGDTERLAPQLRELKDGALRIIEALLYVKQHSINCVAAGMYTMTTFDRTLFPPEEASAFISPLFIHAQRPTPQDAARIREAILQQYRAFLTQGEGASSWEEPLLHFLHYAPKQILKGPRAPGGPPG